MHGLKMGSVNTVDRNHCPFILANEASYREWRDAKLAAIPRNNDQITVPIANLAHSSAVERARIRDAIRRCNMAIYVTTPSTIASDDRGPRQDLKHFLAQFGLVTVERHRSADYDGFVPIEVSNAATKRSFIPYTTRAISWHTDGYYNAPSDSIRAMLLHCVRPAAGGGENALLDPEIAYIRLRDENPEFIAALMHPEAMSIPPSIEEDGSERQESVGPVFAVDESDCSLQMRYTARPRFIAWRNDVTTRAAVAFLERLLKEEREPLIFKVRLNAGEGLICNNVLHTRTAFVEGETGHRLLLRARFATRIASSSDCQRLMELSADREYATN